MRTPRAARVAVSRIAASLPPLRVSRFCEQRDEPVAAYAHGVPVRVQVSYRDGDPRLVGGRPRELAAAVTRGPEVVEHRVDGLDGMPNLAGDRQPLPQTAKDLMGNRMNQGLPRA